MKQIILILAMAIALAFPMKHGGTAGDTAQAQALKTVAPERVELVILPAALCITVVPAGPEAPGRDV